MITVLCFNAILKWVLSLIISNKTKQKESLHKIVNGLSFTVKEFRRWAIRRRQGKPEHGCWHLFCPAVKSTLTFRVSAFPSSNIIVAKTVFHWTSKPPPKSKGHAEERSGEGQNTLLLGIESAPFNLSVHRGETGPAVLSPASTHGKSRDPSQQNPIVHVHDKYVQEKTRQPQSFFIERLYFWSTGLFKGFIKLFDFPGKTRERVGRNLTSTTA